jgi:hypothetical protein
MGILNEFNSIYKDEGIVTAGSWVGRNVLLSFFHPATYRLVDALSPLVLDRNEIEERFQINGSIEYYDREREVEIELPAGEDHVETIAKRSGTYKISKPFVGLLYDVDLFGAYPIPVDNQNKLALETVVSPEVLTLNIAGSVGEFIINPPKKISNGSTAAIDSAVLLYNQWNSGYYHWTVETLNRLEGVEKYTYRTGEQPKLIVGPDPNRFQLETLELLGYDEEDLIRWNQRQGSVDRLVVPSVRREYNLGSVSPIAYQWLRDRMRKAAREEAPDATEKFSKRVYISREDAPRRQIVNENEIVNTLEEHGFKKYVLSDHSVAENIQLFEQSDVIVAPHGAGLTDIIYATDTTVIELFRSNDVRPTYYVLSEHLNHRYRYLLCEYEGPNLKVDPDELESIVVEELRLEELSVS